VTRLTLFAIAITLIGLVISLWVMRDVSRRHNVNVWPFRIPWPVVLVSGYHLLLGIFAIVLIVALLHHAMAWVVCLYIVMALVFIVLGVGLLARWRWARPVLTAIWAIWSAVDLAASIILLRHGRRVSYNHWAPSVGLVVVALALYANRHAREYFARGNASA